MLAGGKLVMPTRAVAVPKATPYGGQPFVLLPKTSDKRIPSGKMERDDHMVKYNHDEPSGISSGDFFVIFGRQGKYMKNNVNLEILENDMKGSSNDTLKETNGKQR